MKQVITTILRFKETPLDIIKSKKIVTPGQFQRFAEAFVEAYLCFLVSAKKMLRPLNS